MRRPAMAFVIFASLAVTATARADLTPLAVDPPPPPPELVPMPPPLPDMAVGNPRLFVLTDIGNEPDDQMSMVRLMVYANEIDIEGLVATTSTWQRALTHPEKIAAIVRDYGVVRPNLAKHASGWPAEEKLASVISSGQPGYGMADVGPGKSTAGSRALIAAADRKDDRPLWVSVWGGANTLAQALFDVKSTRTPAGVAAFVARLRVYSISDQDDAGLWIRRTFPGISYVVDPSTQNSEDYAAATWTGISGDAFYRNGDGADATTISHEWLDANIRKGPLGAHYLRHEFIMEGDTPSYLNLIGNGLEGYRSPSWGGWGGRYVYRQPRGEAHAIWTQGGGMFARIDSRDAVTGTDGRIHMSNQATIWRWREAYQNDFAARMDWTVKSFAAANHRPVAIVNGQAGTAPILVRAEVGKPVTLDASASSDPDRQHLRFTWFVYGEAGYSPGVTMADATIAGANMSRAIVTPKAACRAQWLPRRSKCDAGVVHIILAVTDDGVPQLTSYRRFIFQVREAAASPTG